MGLNDIIWIKIPIECVFCERTFTAFRYNSTNLTYCKKLPRYCSRSCADKHRRRKKKSISS